MTAFVVLLAAAAGPSAAAAEAHATATASPPPPPPPPLSQFRFAQVYSDHMVLQREPQTASIWGFSAPGASVALKAGVATATATATASPAGIWRASLPAQPASSTPVTLTATSGGATISIKDVLFGDVWVCSGQVGLTFSLLCA
jgi:sialate O-acetylesterase